MKSPEPDERWRRVWWRVLDVWWGAWLVVLIIVGGSGLAYVLLWPWVDLLLD